MGEFSWAYIDADALVSASGPTGSVQFRVGDAEGKSAISGSENFIYHTASSLLAVTGNVEISGTLTANQYNINVVDKTVTNISASGNTKFGDTSDDTHQFTGSIFSNGNVTLGDAASDVVTIAGQLTASSQARVAGALTAASDFTVLGDTQLGNAVDNSITVKGTTTHESNVLVQDNKTLLFGSNSDASIQYDEASVNRLIISGSAAGTDITGNVHIADDLFVCGTIAACSPLRLSGSNIQFTGSMSFGESGDATDIQGPLTGTQGVLIPDDKKAIFGTDSDSHISYDEATQNRLIISGSATGLSIGGGSIALDYGAGKAINSGTLAGPGSFIGLASDNTLVLAASAITIDNDSDNRITTAKGDGSLNAEANLTFDNNKLSAIGQISASLGVTGSSLNTAETTINATHISSSLNISGSNFHVGRFIRHAGDSDTFIDFTADDINIQAGGVNFIDITQDTTNEITFNETAADIDFRVEGDSDSHLLYTNGGTNKVGIGVDTPDHKLTVSGDISASVNISGSAFYGSGANLTNIPASAIDAAGSDTQIQFNDSGDLAGSANLTFDNNKLSAIGQISASLGVTGSSLNTAETTINSTHISSSLNISGSAFYGDGSNLTNVGAVGANTQVQFNNDGVFGASANLTFNGSKLSTIGQISASLGVTGSSLNTAETIIDSTHISSSLNISGSAFYGDGANLTNIPADAVGAAGGDRQIQFNDSGDLGASANLIVRSSGDVVVTGSLILTGSGQSLITLDTRDADNLKEIVFNKDGSPAAAIQINSAEHMFIENENTKDIILRANNQNALRVIGSQRRVIVGAVSKTAANADLDVEGSAMVSGSFTVSGSSTIGFNAFHTATVAGQLTASLGVTLGENSFIASDKNIVFGSSGESVIQYNSGISKMVISGSSSGMEIKGHAVSLDFPGGTVKSGSLAGGGSYLGLDSNHNLVLASVSAPPAGSNKQIQFNDAGSAGASANFTFDDTAGAEELILTGSMEVMSGSTTVFEIKTGNENDEKGTVRGRMLHVKETLFDLTSGAQARTGRYVSIGPSTIINSSLTRNNGFLSPFSGKLVSITYQFGAGGGNQDNSKGNCGFAMKTADVNALNGNSMESAVVATSFVTASSWPGNNCVGSINVQTGDGALGGMANVTGSFAFGTGSAVGIFFQSNDSTGNNFPGQCAFTFVFELDQLDPMISGSGN